MLNAGRFVRSRETPYPKHPDSPPILLDFWKKLAILSAGPFRMFGLLALCGFRLLSRQHSLDGGGVAPLALRQG